MSDSLKSQVINGLKWSIIAKAVTQLFSWISTFLVIRWLTPEDYGVMAIAMVFFTLISYFTTNGLTSVLVKEQNCTPLLENQIFTFSIVLNLALSGIIAFTAPYLSAYYGIENLRDVMYALAIVNPVTSFIVVPMARMQRDMRFKEKSFVEGGAALAGAVTALGMAFYGFSYWSLVGASMSILIVRSILYRVYTGKMAGVTMQFSNIKHHLFYAWNIQIGTLLWFLYNKADTVILGKMLGMEKLGIYNVANDIAAIPLSKGSAILNEVGFAAFSKVSNDRNLAKHYASRSMLMISIVMFPVFYGIAAVSNEIVMLLIGEKWAEAAPVITLLCLIFPFRMQSSVLANFANGMGDAKFNLHNGFFVAATLIFSITIGAMYGLIGAAAGWVIGYVVAYAFTLIRFKLRYKFETRQLLPYTGVWVVSTLMLAVTMISPYCLPELSEITLLIVKMLIGGTIIVPPMWFMYKKDVMSILKKD